MNEYAHKLLKYTHAYIQACLPQGMNECVYRRIGKNAKVQKGEYCIALCANKQQKVYVEL